MEKLTAEQAFKVMVIYLEGIYARTRSDDVGGLLGDLMLRADGTTADPAAWSDWLAGVKAVMADSQDVTPDPPHRRPLP